MLVLTGTLIAPWWMRSRGSGSADAGRPATRPAFSFFSVDRQFLGFRYAGGQAATCNRPSCPQRARRRFDLAVLGHLTATTTRSTRSTSARKSKAKSTLPTGVAARASEAGVAGGADLERDERADSRDVGYAACSCDLRWRRRCRHRPWSMLAEVGMPGVSSPRSCSRRRPPRPSGTGYLGEAAVADPVGRNSMKLSDRPVGS